MQHLLIRNPRAKMSAVGTSSPDATLVSTLVSAVDLALALENSRGSLQDALRARDSAVSLVVQACRAVGEKVSIINVLEAINANLELRLGVAGLESLSVSEKTSKTRSSYEHDIAEARMEQELNKRRSLLVLSRTHQTSMDAVCSNHPSVVPSSTSTLAFPSRSTSFSFDSDHLGADYLPRRFGDSASIQARLDALSILPLPRDAPVDALCAFMLPSQLTFHRFVDSLPEDVCARLGAYVIFEEATTAWCSEREEHGCLLVPAFRCFTHPCVVTAHHWAKADILGPLAVTAHCFYHKDGKFYYAGAYIGVRLDDLDADEWCDLPAQTSQALLKQTLADRSNVSPTNNFEVTQLYAAGALTVACVGLQCVGFDKELSSAILNCAEDLVKLRHCYPTTFAERKRYHALPATSVSIARHWSSVDELRPDKQKHSWKHSF